MNGYDTQSPCCICGGVNNCKVEPRYGYTVCVEHAGLSPVEVSKQRDNYGK